MDVDLTTATNFLVLKMREYQLNSLVSALSVIACWLRQSSAFSKPVFKKLDGRLQNDLDVFIRTDLLPQLCGLFELSDMAALAGYDATLKG
jgi:hypothetical protein